MIRCPCGVQGAKARQACRPLSPRISRPCRTSLVTLWPGKRGPTAHMPGGVAADARRHLPPVSSARANSVAGGLGARPGQRPVPAEQDLRETFHGFLAGPVALQLTTHLD